MKQPSEKFITEQEAYALGWFDAQKDIEPLTFGVCPAEIRDNEWLANAWLRGFDEGCQWNLRDPAT